MRRHIRKLLPDHEAIRNNRWLSPFRKSLLHPRLWHLNRHSAAGAVAAGMFCGLIPGPLQMLGAAICALIFRVNLPLAMFTTLYTNPLTIIPLYVIAFAIGQALLGDGSQRFVAPPEPDGMTLASWLHALVDWMIGLGSPLALGLIVLATGLALAGYLAVKLAWRIWLVRAWHRRQQRVHA